FSPGIWWIGFRMNRSGSEVQILHTSPASSISSKPNAKQAKKAPANDHRGSIWGVIFLYSKALAG
ncbi:hypothetical protein M3P21_21345, partial [Ruegeria sp. 2012CJ41-6]